MEELNGLFLIGMLMLSNFMRIWVLRFCRNGGFADSLERIWRLMELLSKRMNEVFFFLCFFRKKNLGLEFDKFLLCFIVI